MTASTPQSAGTVPPFLLEGLDRAWSVVSGGRGGKIPPRPRVGVAPGSLTQWVAALTQAILDAPKAGGETAAEAGLDALHRAALAALVRQRTEAERKERERMAAAAGQQAAAAGAALRQLASPLRSGSSPFEAGEGTVFAGPFLRACQAVGKALGVPIRTPRGAGLSSEGVEAVARASGIRTRRVALKGGWWGQPQRSMSRSR